MWVQHSTKSCSGDTDKWTLPRFQGVFLVEVTLEQSLKGQVAKAWENPPPSGKRVQFCMGGSRGMRLGKYIRAHLGKNLGLGTMSCYPVWNLWTSKFQRQNWRVRRRVVDFLFCQYGLKNKKEETILIHSKSFSWAPIVCWGVFWGRGWDWFVHRGTLRVQSHGKPLLEGMREIKGNC